MNKFKRKIKNIIRNIILNEKLSQINIIKNIRKNRLQKIEDGRRLLFEQYSEECLKSVKKALEEYNLDFWLDYGTLLGAIREKDFINHDLDLDFGMFYSEDQFKVKEALERYNIKKVREFTLDGKTVEETYSYKGLYFDIFYYFYNENLMWTYGFTYKNNKLVKENYEDKDISTGFKGQKYFVNKRGLEKIKFKGDEFLVPEDPHGYLRENYGENYMTPVQEWDYVEAPSNIEKLNDGDIVMIEYYN